MLFDVASETGVTGLHRVTPGEGQAMHACLREHWPASVKFIGQLEEEGGDFGQWWTERWPRPQGVLCRGRRAFSLFAADEEAAERILEGIDLAPGGPVLRAGSQVSPPPQS